MPLSERLRLMKLLNAPFVDLCRKESKRAYGSLELVLGAD
jgi:hypothetical protein